MRDGLQTADVPSTVTDYLENDHRRLDALLEDALRLNEAESCSEALPPFREFARGLGRHIEVEERVLFPVLESLIGAQAGPMVVMRAEHVEIRRELDRAGDRLEAQDASGARSALRALRHLLSEHNLKEEEILYPTADELVGGPRERQELVERLRSF